MAIWRTHSRTGFTSRIAAGLLGLALLTAACESSGAPDQPAPSAAAPEEFEPLPRAKPPVIEAKLTPENNEKCLYRQPIDVQAVAGMYTGPQDFIQDQVETTRSIEFTSPEVSLVQPKAFDRAVVEAGVTVPPDERVTTKLLAWALGVTPQGFNVNFFLAGDDAGLVAGFYNPADQQIVIERKGKLDSEYVVMAHEMTHAAADQRFGLPAKGVEPIVDDVSLARSALVEGDASLSELRLLSRLSPPKAVEKAVAAQIAFKDRFAEDRGAGIPYLLIDTALFPYQSGLAFACTVFQEEGWKGIDRGYNDPPTTTAQVLFPERYLDREEAVDPPNLGHPPEELWQVRDKGQIGAAHLKAMFEAPGDREDQALSRPLGRAASWAGGRYQVWTVGVASTEYIVGLTLVEHEDYEGLLCSSLRSWYRAAFGDADEKLVADGVVEFEGADQDAVLSCQGREVQMSFAPNLDLARPIVGLE